MNCDEKGEDGSRRNLTFYAPAEQSVTDDAGEINGEATRGSGAGAPGISSA